MSEQRKDKSNDVIRAEFDLLADEYESQHAANIAITGEKPDYFAEYKIRDVAGYVQEHTLPSKQIFDFGCGIGNSVPFFRKYFPHSSIHCGDVSKRSIEIATTRFPGPEVYTLIEDNIPLPDNQYDLIFTACVFHHIPHDQHNHWLRELQRICRPGGIIVIYEHNPWNPLTIRAVNSCPLDVNAKLIPAPSMKQRLKETSWTDIHISYKLFFPAMLQTLRTFEKQLGWLPLGAQYRAIARH